ncbi:MAG: PEP-CTERM sorting domain-containing protein, partial [Phycisphaerae bacterium]
VWADFHIGMNSRASVTVTGAGSSVSCPGWGGLFVAYGNTGDASLTISDGASVSDVNGHIAFSPGSRGTVLVEGLGSLWKNSGSLLVGGASEPGGRATLTIRDGGRVTHGDGSRIFPGGTVCLEGGTLTGWSMLNEGLILGHGEVGSQVTNGQGGEIRVETGDRLLLGGSNGGNRGLISLQGGTMELAQALVNEGDGDVLGRGTLIAHGGVSNHGDIGLSNGISDLYGDVDNNAGGRVVVSGRADVTFWGDVANNAEALFKVSAGSSATFFGEYSGGDIDGEGEVYFEDDVTPGFSPAMISFGGDVTFAPTARLNVELANSDNSSPADPRFDALDVAGDVDLAGTLSVEWLPVPGDPGSKFGGIYSILTWGGTRAGTFDGIDCRMQAYLDTSVFPDGIEYDDGNSEVRIHLHDLLDGDADLDGRVAREDFHALEVGFGSPDPDWFDGDFNFDGRVDFLDYLTWKANAGDAVPGAVPEPTTLAILAVGIVVLTGRRRRR